jgi:hypothetical protein
VFYTCPVNHCRSTKGKPRKLASDNFALSSVTAFWGSTPLLLLGPTFFSDYSFCVRNPLTGMTGSSLHMQWPLTSQLQGSFLKENNCFFVTDQTPYPFPTRSLPAQFWSLYMYTVGTHALSHIAIFIRVTRWHIF